MSYTGHIALEGVYCTSARFRQEAEVTGDPRRPPRSPEEVNLAVRLASRFSGEDRCEVQLEVQVIADPENRQPYSVDVVYVGRFRFGELPEDLSREQFIERNAAAILFPYVREAVGNLTSRGAFGPLWIPPVNVVAMLESGKQAESAPVE